MEYVVKLYVAGKHYLEQLELQLDLDQPVHQNSSHLLVDRTAKQVVSFNSTEGLHRSDKKVKQPQRFKANNHNMQFKEYKLDT